MVEGEEVEGVEVVVELEMMVLEVEVVVVGIDSLKEWVFIKSMSLSSLPCQQLSLALCDRLSAMRPLQVGRGNAGRTLF